MADLSPPHPTARDRARLARGAGLLYLVIIVAGLSAELGLRGPLIDPSDAARTAEAILAAPLQFRLGMAADLLMALCDAGLAITLFVLFRAVAPGLALSALVFRLLQTGVIAANLMLLLAAWQILAHTPGLPVAQAQSLAASLLDLHGQGYDLGLTFFGVNCVLSGLLICRSGYFAPLFGTGLMAAGGVYLLGGGLRILAPDLSDSFAPAYLVPLLAETAFCLRLLIRPPAKPDPA